QRRASGTHGARPQLLEGGQDPLQVHGPEHPGRQDPWRGLHELHEGRHCALHRLIREIFATRIYQASLADERGFAAFNAELADACAMLAAEDKAGRAWCKANGYGGYTSYASLDDLPTRATVFAELKRRLDRHVGAFAEALGLELGRRKLRLDS